MSDNELNARFNILPGDDSGAQLLDAFNQRVAAAKKQVDSLTQAFEDLEDTELQHIQDLMNAFNHEQMAKTNAELNEMRNELLEAADAAGQAETEVDGFTKALAKATRAAEIDALGAKFGKLAREEKNAKEAAESLRKELEQVGATGAEIDRAVGSFERTKRGDADVAGSSGDIGSISSSIAGVIGDLGGGAAQELFALFGDLGDVTEKLPRVGKGILDIGAAAAEAGTVLPFLATGLTTLMPGLTAAAAGLGAMALAAVPVALAVGGLVATFQKAAEQADIANAASKQFFATREAQFEIATSGMTEQEAEKRLTILRNEEAAKSSIVTDAESARRQTFEQASDQASKTFGILGDASARLATSFFEGRGGFNELDEGIKSTNTDLVNIRGEIQALEYALESGTLTLNTSVEAVEALQKEQEKYSGQLEQSKDRLVQVRQQQEQLIANFEKQQSRQADAEKLREDRAGQDLGIAMRRSVRDTIRQASRDTRDRNRQLEGEEEQHRKALADISKRGQDRIIDLEKGMTDRRIDTARKIDEANKKAAESEEKATRDFNDKIAKIEEDARRKRAEAEEAQSEARLNFDVLAYKKAQKDLEKIDEEEASDKGIASGEFEREKAERTKALAERIADINAELTKYTESTAAKIELIRQQTADEIIQSNLAFAEKQALDAESRRIAREDAAEDRRIAAADAADDLKLRRERDAEDRSIRNAITNEDHQAALLRIAELKGAEIARLIEIKMKLSEVSTTFNEEMDKINLSIINMARIATGNAPFASMDEATRTAAAPPSIGDSTPFNLGFPDLPAPASDDNRPSVGGGRDEIAGIGMGHTSRMSGAASFASRSGGRSGAMGGGSTIIVNAVVGDVATLSKVKQIAGELANKIDAGDRATQDGTKMALRRGKRSTLRRR